MDLLDVLKPVVDFFIEMCEVTLTVGGYTFTVGAVFIWSGIAVIMWSFIRGLSD